ncbi:MAG TPA: hypothetical protein VGA52_13610 [Anaerolineales bacterium]
MSYSLGKEEMGFAVSALRQAGEVHYDSPCPRCRTKNRLSLEQLEQEVQRRGIEVPTLDEGDSESS